MGWRKGSKSSAMNQSRLQRIQKWQSWGRLESQQTYRTKAAHSRTCTGSWSSNLSPVSNGVTQQACHGEHEGRGQERERVPARRRWLRGRASRAGSFTRHSTYVADKGKRCYKILKCGELQLTEFCRLKLTLPFITGSNHKRIVCSWRRPNVENGASVEWVEQH